MLDRIPQNHIKLSMCDVRMNTLYRIYSTDKLEPVGRSLCTCQPYCSKQTASTYSVCEQNNVISPSFVKQRTKLSNTPQPLHLPLTREQRYPIHTQSHQHTMATSTNTSTPLSTAKTFLAGIKARDKVFMRTVSHPDATACLIREGKPIHILIANVLDLMPDDGKVEMDEVSYDEVEHVDGDFATVWTPYRFYEDGKVSS